MDRGKKSRAFIIVFNNPLDTFEEALVNDIQYDYLIFQYEMGDSGTPHLQGYIRFPNPISVTQFRADMPGAHIEIAKGGPNPNLHYCSKPVPKCSCDDCVGSIRLDGPFEFGVRASNWIVKPRTKPMADLVAYARTHTVVECIEKYPMALRMQGAILSFQQAIIAPRCKPPIVIILWGDSGAGKTRFVYDNHPSVYKLKQARLNGETWFDRYANQNALLLDDWRLAEDNTLQTYYLLLDLLDRYQYTGGMKSVYGGCQVNSEFIYLTNNDHSLSWFGGQGLMNLTRRVTAIAHVQTGQNVQLIKNN